MAETCWESIQIVTSSVRSQFFHSRCHPGASVGLTTSTGLNYGVSYSNAADDELVYSTTRTLFEQVENYTRSTGQHVPFIYMNYALPTQKVIESYGQENVDFLRAVSRK